VSFCMHSSTVILCGSAVSRLTRHTSTCVQPFVCQDCRSTCYIRRQWRICCIRECVLLRHQCTEAVASP
jgi:hypothetical protein